MGLEQSPHTSSNLSPDEVLNHLDTTKEIAANTIKFWLIKEAGMDESINVNVETAPGKKLAKITLDEQGVYTTLIINGNNIDFTCNHLSEENELVTRVENIHNKHKILLNDYFKSVYRKNEQ